MLVFVQPGWLLWSIYDSRGLDRDPSNPERELSFLEKIISCIKMSKQFYKTDLNLT